jgi:hypothetical protein
MVMKTHTEVLQAMTPCSMEGEWQRVWEMSQKVETKLFGMVVPTYHSARCHYVKDYNMKVIIVLACAGSQCILCNAYSDFHPYTGFMRGQLLFCTLNCGCDSVYGLETWWRPYVDLSWLPDGLPSGQTILYLNPEQYRTQLNLNTHMAEDLRKNMLYNFVCIIVDWLIYMPAYPCPNKRC